MLLAVSVLQDERVRAQLRKAPVAVREWAAARRTDDRDAHDQGGERGLERLDPTRRFGQRGIARRLSALRRNAELVFPDGSDTDATTILQAIDELDWAASISATMTLNDRRKTRARITRELTRLERALVDAVLPPTS